MKSNKQRRVEILNRLDRPPIDCKSVTRKIKAIAAMADAGRMDSGLDANGLEGVIDGCFQMASSALADLRRVEARLAEGLQSD